VPQAPKERIMSKGLWGLLSFVLMMVVLTVAASMAMGASPCADGDDACWEEYSQAAEKGVSEAGKPTPGMSFTSCTKKCKEGCKAVTCALAEKGKEKNLCIKECRQSCDKGVCGKITKSVTEGIIAGEKWCTDPERHAWKLEQVRRRWAIYGKWFQEFTKEGSTDPVHLALITTFTSPTGFGFPGEPACSPDSSLKECGILGIKRSDAKWCDVNVCSVRASIWCAAWAGNKKSKGFREQYLAADFAPPKEAWMIAGLGSAIGGLAKYVLKESHALDFAECPAPCKSEEAIWAYQTAPPKLKYEHPWDRVVAWLKANSKDLDNLGILIAGGRISPFKVGLRVGRWVPTITLIEEFSKEVGLVPKWGSPVEVQRPADLPKYPGDAKHGRCEKWPELVGEMP
jgi:hypothetical protein